MNKPCDICLDETCGGKHNCNCGTCKVRSSCNRFLSPTIRITTKCTQSCRHCCWECSPIKKDFMSVETAEKVSKFIVSNSISRCTLTGGEFFCNPNWRDIFDLIIPKVKICRLITNGDWGIDSSIPKFLSRYRDNLYVSISDDN